ncbi:MAG: aspartate kinase [Planctomycetes bacterium]|nr:aspartate kinase [Planctomycetota bacterium]
MGVKVAKFGGTSLADAAQVRKVEAIIRADPARRFVVPSAPGKRTSDDRKITDLLYLCHASAAQQVPFDETWKLISDRYLQIAADLKIKLDMRPHLDEVKKKIAAEGARAGGTADYAASRGEYLNSLIVAELLGYEFIDAAEVIFFDARGLFDAERTQQALSARLAKSTRAVVPGFYGTDHAGRVKTFSRGGSDITGAIVARAAFAEVYENWTDVSGLLMADPRIVKNPRPIDVVTYRELRELAYMGATVLHDEAIFPVRIAGIPVNIRNTNRPDDKGTMIVANTAPIAHTGSITGIAGRKDFTVITVEKALMNQEVGFGRRMLSVLEVNGISFEHMPSGIDTMSVVVADKAIEGRLDKVLDELRAECKPDAIDVEPHMALVATVGRGMASTPGMAARLFGALAAAQVNVRMIDQGSSEINIIVGVGTKDFENAMRAVYEAFVK